MIPKANVTGSCCLTQRDPATPDALAADDHHAWATVILLDWSDGDDVVQVDGLSVDDPVPFWEVLRSTEAFELNRPPMGGLAAWRAQFRRHRWTSPCAVVLSRERR